MGNTKDGCKSEVDMKDEKDITVILKGNVKDFSPEEWYGDFCKIVEHIGQKGSATLAVDNGVWDRNYYDVVFSDGYLIEAISSIHLDKA